MSIMAISRWTRKYGVYVVSFMGAVMLLGAVYTGFGRNIGNVPVSGDAPRTERIAATVDGRKIAFSDIDDRLRMRYRQQEMMGQPGEPEASKKDIERISSLDGFKQEAAIIRAAKAKGITVTPEEIAKERESQWQAARPQLATRLGLDEKATDDQIDIALQKQSPNISVKFLKEQSFSDENLTSQIADKRLREELKKSVTVDPVYLKRSYNEIQVRHILIKWGENGVTEEQARAKAQALLDKVKKDPTQMAKLATENTDDPGSKKTGGAYSNWTVASTYVPAFTKGAFDGGLNKVYPQLVRVAEANYKGFHIVRLEGERPGKGLPKDWDKNSQKYIDENKDQMANRAYSTLVMGETPNVVVSITDSLLKATNLLKEAYRDPLKKNAMLEEALGELKKVAAKDDIESVAPVRKAEILTALGRRQEAIAAYQEAIQARNIVETRFALLGLLLQPAPPPAPMPGEKPVPPPAPKIDENDKKLAASVLEETEKLAIPTSQMAYGMSSFYQQVGNKTQADKWMKQATEYVKRESEKRQQQQAEMMKMFQEMQAKEAAKKPPAPAPKKK